MHDLTVADIHTYYVVAGDEPVLVHNCKTDAGLKADAEALHSAYANEAGPGLSQRLRRNGITVATSEIDGKLYYSVSRNRTSPAMRKLADELGYERISGSRFTSVIPRRWHAEHILMNRFKDYFTRGGGGRIVPSRPRALRAAQATRVAPPGWQIPEPQTHVVGATTCQQCGNKRWRGRPRSSGPYRHVRDSTWSCRWRLDPGGSA